MRLPCWHIVFSNGRWKVERFKLHEMPWKSQKKPSVYGLQNEKTMIFIGPANYGKSEFAMGLGSEFAKRKDLPGYGYGTPCNYGAVTKANQMRQLGAFVSDDFDLTTRGGDHQITMNEMKQFLYVKLRGTVCAFYNAAVFPENIPRLWCVNNKNRQDKTAWFEANNYKGRTQGLIELINCNEEFFNDPETDQNHVAIGRRAVIIDVQESLFIPDTVSATHARMNDDLAVEALRATPMPDF